MIFATLFIVVRSYCVRLTPTELKYNNMVLIQSTQEWNNSSRNFVT